MIKKPQILLLDEPSSGMDPGSQKMMWEALEKVKIFNPDLSILLTTHSMDEAEFLSGTIAIMTRGGVMRF
jgi:ABC-type multidrug transport system ATPase subunit